MANKCKDKDRFGGEKEAFSLKSSISNELQAGVEVSKDPENAGLPDLAIRKTTMYSPWFMKLCPLCGLEFREEDRVRLCPQCGRAYHDDPRYNLRCWRRHFARNPFCSEEIRNRDGVLIRKKCDFRPEGDLPRPESDDGKTAVAFRRLNKLETQFVAGLQRVWKPFGEREVVAVKENDCMVGMKCPWCRSYIRAGDHVVKCPCGKCETWFHMDVVRHLACWNEWSGSKGHDFCPVTCARIEPGEDGETGEPREPDTPDEPGRDEIGP